MTKQLGPGNVCQLQSLGVASEVVKHRGRVNACVPDFGQPPSKPGAIRSFEAPRGSHELNAVPQSR